MIAVIKNYTLPVMLKKLILLYFLNVMDIVFTLILQRTGYFVEANPVMCFFMFSTYSALAVKIILPAMLCSLLYIRFKKATDTQLRKSNIMITILVFIYASINLLHLIWLSMYFIYA